MSFGDVVVGALYFAASVGLSLAAAAIVLRRRLRELTGATAATAYVLLATAAVILVHLIPAMLGILSRPAVLGAAVLLLLAAIRVPPLAGSAPRPAPPPLGRSGALMWAVALAASLAAAVWTVAGAYSLTRVPLTDFDMLTFKLPILARWIQDGSLWHANELAAFFGQGAYPNNGDVILLAGILPWHATFMIRPIAQLYLLLGGLSVYALARELRAPRAPALLVAAVGVTLPIASSTAAVDALPDAVAVAPLVGGVTFLLRHERTGARSDLLLAGLGLGLAFGVKWYGVAYVAAAIVLWALVGVARRLPARRLARDAGILGGVVALAGGFWLLRNAIVYDDPLYPASIPFFNGAPHLVTEYRYGPSILDAVKAGAFGRAVWPVWRYVYGVGGALAAIALVIGSAVVVAVRSRWRDRLGSPAPFVVALLGLICAAIYTVLPFTAQESALGRFDNVAADTRYMTAPLMLGLAVAAYLGARSRALRAVLAIAGAVAVEQGIERVWGQVSAGDALIGALAVGVAALVVTIARITPRRLSIATPRRLSIATAITCGVALVLVGAWGIERRQLEPSTYAGDPVFAWISAHLPANARIALAGPIHGSGVPPTLPLFGPRLTRDVQFLGPSSRHQLGYWANPSSWWRALVDGRYDALVVDEAREFALLPQSHDLRYALAAHLQLLAISPELAVFRAPPYGTPEPHSLAAIAAR